MATPAQKARAQWSIGPWLAGYKLRVLSAEALRVRATGVVFRGRDAVEIAAIGARYATEMLPGVLRPAMMERIDWHKARGDTVAIVSASLDVYLQPWCALHGLELACNRLEALDGRLSGRYLGGDRGRHKAADIRSRYDLSRFDRVHAYGDSREDRPMLALAHERWYRGHRLA